MAVTARAGIRALSSTSSIPSDASFWGPLGGGDGVVVCFSESPLAPSVPPSLPRPSLPPFVVGKESEGAPYWSSFSYSGHSGDEAAFQCTLAPTAVKQSGEGGRAGGSSHENL